MAFRIGYTYKSTSDKSDVPVIGIMLGNGYINGIKEMESGLKILEDVVSVSYEIQDFNYKERPNDIVKYAEGAKEEGLKVIVVKSYYDSEDFTSLVKSKTILPVLTVPNVLGNYDNNYCKSVTSETILDACRIVSNDDEVLAVTLEEMRKVLELRKYEFNVQSFSNSI